MDNVIFEDDMKEFKGLAWVLLGASILAALALVANICVGDPTQIDIKFIVIAGVVVVLLLCYAIYLVLYVARYKVTVTSDTIYVNSIFGSKTLKLTTEIAFESKKYNSKYRIFKVSAGKNTVTVRTKKSEEFTKILNEFIDTLNIQ